MRIKTLTLKDTRVYDQVHLEAHPYLNIIVGDNAEGKTTLLESIHVLGFTKSHRTQDEKELMKTGALFAKVSSTADDQQLEVVISAEGKTVKHNDVKSRRLSDYVGLLKVVMFAPEDLELLKGAPKLRRQFLDMQSGLFDKQLLRELGGYKHLLKERNYRLKQVASLEALREDALFSVFSQRLAQSASYIIGQRKIFLTAINEHLGRIYQSIAEDGEFPQLIYQPSVEGDLETQWTAHLEKEFITKSTQVGPHRDDFNVVSHGKDFTAFASQGQLRTVGIALKLVLVQLLKAQKDSTPVILLDDVLSELDAKRQNLLLKQLNQESQVFITATDIKSIQTENLSDYALFNVNNGKVERLWINIQVIHRVIFKSSKD